MFLSLTPPPASPWPLRAAFSLRRVRQLSPCDSCSAHRAAIPVIASPVSAPCNTPGHRHAGCEAAFSLFALLWPPTPQPDVKDYAFIIRATISDAHLRA